MKNFLLIFCVFLSGCFNGNDPESINLQKFKINNTTFEISLPRTWEILTPNNKKGEIILAQKNDQNIIITHQYNFSEKTPEIIINSLKKNLFSFKLLEKKEDIWLFEGKLSVKTLKRNFYQKIVLIPDSKEFLLGSCSSEVFENRKSDCNEILASFGISE